MAVARGSPYHAISSSHAQGVLSQLWPDVDMPYCVATGIRPDLIINPNAFPSRMTIGMLIESMASKAGALNGEFVDASPFQPSIRVRTSEAFVRVWSDHEEPRDAPLILCVCGHY